MRRGAGHRAELMFLTMGIDFNMSMNLEIRQATNLHINLRSNEMIKDVNSA